MKSKFYSFILPVFFPVLSFSNAFADAVYEPGRELDHAENILPYMALILLALCVSLVQLAARGLMLNKCCVSGWKIIIPFYGRYLEYKTYWKSKYFWINFGISVYLLAALAADYNAVNKILIGIIAILFFFAALVYVIIIIYLRMNTLDIFGYNRKLAFLELVCMGFILDFICGFSRRGRIEKKKPADRQVQEEQLDNWA